VASVIWSDFRSEQGRKGEGAQGGTLRRSLSPRHRCFLLLLLIGLATGCNESPVPGGGLEDLAGAKVSPFATPNAKALVFLFLNVDCPISNRYAPEVRRLRDKFAAQPVVWRLVYPGTDATAESVRKHIREFALPGDALRDPQLRFTKAARVQVTPEAAVFLPDGQLVYHGRIDDQFVDLGVKRPAPNRRDLQEALDEILAGKPVSHPETKAVGCLIQGLP
jgi:hypothetical protein